MDQRLFLLDIFLFKPIGLEVWGWGAWTGCVSMTDTAGSEETLTMRPTTAGTEEVSGGGFAAIRSKAE